MPFINSGGSKGVSGTTIASQLMLVTYVATGAGGTDVRSVGTPFVDATLKVWVDELLIYPGNAGVLTISVVNGSGGSFTFSGIPPVDSVITYECLKR